MRQLIHLLITKNEKTMKKYFTMAMMALAIGFTSCDQKKEAQTDAADVFVSELQEMIENNDTAAVEAQLNAISGVIANAAEENPEEAQALLAKVQEYLKQNTEKISSLIGENADAEEVFVGLVNTPAEAIISVLKAGQSVADNTEATAEDVVETAEEAVQNKVDEAVNEANKKVEEQKAEANKKVNEAKEKANEEVNKAAQKANDEVNKAADKLLKGAGLK